MAKRGRPKKENPHGVKTIESEGSTTLVDLTGSPNEDSAHITPPETEGSINTLMPDCAAPSKYTRSNKSGLLNSVKYKYNEDGSINWRGMIDPKHLFPNRSWFEARNKAVPSSTEGLQDHQLLIKLAGIKELAKLRGYSSVSYDIIKCEKDHVAIKCRINWINNVESSAGYAHKGVSFEDVANATVENTSSFATKFLETIAANRAFVRCVRNFLNVHIVGDDEIDKSNGQLHHPESEDPTEPLKKLTPNGVLESLCQSKLKCNSFDDFKNKLREMWSLNLYRNDQAKEWSNFDDIPAKEARMLINTIKNEN